MRRTSASRWFTTSVVCSLIATATAATAVAAMPIAQRWWADVSGKWGMTLAGPDSAIESVVELKQSGDTLTGTIGNQMFGTGKLTGTVKGDTIQFSYALEVQGMKFDMQATGMVKDKDNISGNLAAPNGMGSFPFTMKRTP